MHVHLIKYLITPTLLFVTQNVLAGHIASRSLDLASSNNQIVSNKNIKYELLNEKEDTGWALYIDNDVIVSRGRSDQDYTGGFSFTLSGHRATNYLLSIDSWRQYFHELIGLDKLYNDKAHFKLHSFNFGFTLFTPANLSSSAPILDEHPYASFFYISNSNEIVVPEDDIAYQSILSIGFLGLDLAEDVQKSVHRLLNSDEPMGWDNQISSGGELTAKYTFAAQKILNRSHAKEYTRHELKLTGEANLGFGTNISAGFNWRWGRITTPWWSFTPHLSDYINMGVPIAKETEKTHDPEFFLWLGSSYHVRLYDAILQGQFRNSAVTFDDNELERTMTELSVGITREFSNNIRISFFYRKRTAILKLPDVRRPKWGGIAISKSF